MWLGTQTNKVAECKGLIHGLEHAVSHVAPADELQVGG